MVHLATITYLTGGSFIAIKSSIKLYGALVSWNHKFAFASYVVNQLRKIFRAQIEGNVHISYFAAGYSHGTGSDQCFLSPFSRTNGTYCPSPSLPLSLDSWGRYTSHKHGEVEGGARSQSSRHSSRLYLLSGDSKLKSLWEAKLHADPDHIPTLKSQSRASRAACLELLTWLLTSRSQWTAAGHSGRGRARARARKPGCCLARGRLLDVSAQPSLLLLLMPLLLSNMSLLFRAFHQRAATCKTRRVASDPRGGSLGAREWVDELVGGCPCYY